MNNQIIWQPKSIYEEGPGFTILLDPKFAKIMLESKLSKENYQRFQELPKELIGFKHYDPYVFHQDTCFVREINLDAGNGKCISLDDVLPGAIPNLSKPIKYSTHNFDYKPSYLDVINIMKLFDLWIEYSDLLKNL